MDAVGLADSSVLVAVEVVLTGSSDVVCRLDELLPVHWMHLDAPWVAAIWQVPVNRSDALQLHRVSVPGSENVLALGGGRVPLVRVAAPLSAAAVRLSCVWRPKRVVPPMRSSSALSWVTSCWAALRALMSCEPELDA